MILNNHISIPLLLSGVLVGGYICTRISHLLDFDMANILSFDTKYVLWYGTQQNTHLDFDMAEVVWFMMFYEQLLGTKVQTKPRRWEHWTEQIKFKPYIKDKIKN